MSMVMTESYGNIRIPRTVVDVKSFFRWSDSSRLPEKLRVHFIRGEVWLDFSMEELSSHNQIKNALGITLGSLIRDEGLGLYVPDGMMLANAGAALVTAPDAMFISVASLKSKRVRFVAGKRPGAVATRAVGSPDLVVEIVSDNSEEKDTEWLMTAYHEAGISEYWLIDGRDEADLKFDLLRRGPEEFIATRKSDGWVKSAVLKRSFRLTQTKGTLGLPLYRLEVR